MYDDVKTLPDKNAFVSIISSSSSDEGFKLLLETNTIQRWLQEAIRDSEYEGQMAPWSMEQNNRHHELTLEQHTLLVLKNSIALNRVASPEKQLILRLTAICHDIGKMYIPIHKLKPSGSTSYIGHEYHSSILTELLFHYLKMDAYIPHVKPLVLHHMRPHTLVETHSPKSLRKLLRDLANEGASWIDLLKQAEADALGKRRVHGPEEELYLSKLAILRTNLQEIEQI